MNKLAVTLPEAAAMTGISVDTLRRYIRATEGPTLRAKRIAGPTSALIVRIEDLQALVDSLMDA